MYLLVENDGSLKIFDEVPQTAHEAVRLINNRLHGLTGAICG